MSSTHKILCPTDFSESSLEGIKVGNDLALRFSGEVLLIHVIPPVHSITPAFMSPGRMLGDYYEEMVRVAQDALKQTAELHFSKGVPVQTHVLRGNPPEEIVRIAEEKKRGYHRRRSSGLIRDASGPFRVCGGEDPEIVECSCHDRSRNPREEYSSLDLEDPTFRKPHLSRGIRVWRAKGERRIYSW